MEDLNNIDKLKDLLYSTEKQIADLEIQKALIEHFIKNLNK